MWRNVIIMKSFLGGEKKIWGEGEKPHTKHPWSTPFSLCLMHVQVSQAVVVIHPPHPFLFFLAFFLIALFYLFIYLLTGLFFWGFFLTPHHLLPAVRWLAVDGGAWHTLICLENSHSPVSDSPLWHGDHGVQVMERSGAERGCAVLWVGAGKIHHAGEEKKYGCVRDSSGEQNNGWRFIVRRSVAARSVCKI